MQCQTSHESSKRPALLVVIVGLLLAVQGCAEFTQPLQPSGGLNTPVLEQAPGGPETIRALFDASVPERIPDFRQYRASHDRIWTATIDALKTLPNPIVNTSRETGTIVTDYMERRGFPAIKPWRDRYYITVSRLSEAETRVTIRRIVEEQEKLERVRSVAGLTSRTPVGFEWTKKQSNGNYESYLLTLIERGVQTRLSLPQTPFEPPAEKDSIPQVSLSLLYEVVGRYNVREKPNGRILTILDKGSEVTVLETSGEWSNIRLKNGQTGWIVSRALRKKSQQEQTARQMIAPSGKPESLPKQEVPPRAVDVPTSPRVYSQSAKAQVVAVGGKNLLDVPLVSHYQYFSWKTDSVQRAHDVFEKVIIPSVQAYGRRHLGKEGGSIEGVRYQVKVTTVTDYQAYVNRGACEGHASVMRDLGGRMDCPQLPGFDESYGYSIPLSAIGKFSMAQITSDELKKQTTCVLNGTRKMW